MTLIRVRGKELGKHKFPALFKYYSHVKLLLFCHSVYSPRKWTMYSVCMFLWKRVFSTKIQLFSCQLSACEHHASRPLFCYPTPPPPHSQHLLNSLSQLVINCNYCCCQNGRCGCFILSSSYLLC